MTIDEFKENLISLFRSSSIVKSMLERFKLDDDILDDLHLAFDHLPVSAAYFQDKIIINEKFLDEDFIDDVHYFIHELTHYFQDKSNEVKKYDYINFSDYLDYPPEYEAFRYQIEFMKDFYGDKFAEEYVDKLLKFHNYKGKEKEERRSKLLGG